MSKFTLGTLPQGEARFGGGAWIQRLGAADPSPPSAFPAVAGKASVRRISGERPIVGPSQICIYCGATHDLSDEHSIPYALDGKWLLPKASCPTCRNITSKIERVCAKTLLGPMRSQHGYQTRRKKRPPPTVTIAIPDGGGSESEKTVQIPAPEAPFVPFAIPLFEPPGILTGRLPGVGRKQDHLLWVPPFDHSNPKNRRKIERLATKQVLGFRYQTDNASMARLLCKIAYCEAVAWFGRDNVPRDLTLAINGLQPNLTDFVGMSLFPPFGSVAEPENRTTLMLWEGYPGPHLLCQIELFNRFGAPAYLVVVGRANSIIASRFGL